MRVLLIYTNQEHSPYPIFPLGLAYVDASLRQRGIETRVLDLCFESDAARKAAQAAQEFKPDCIGLSIRNIDNLTYGAPVEYVPLVRPVVEACRHVCAAPIVAGGAGFSVLPQQILEALDLQVGIVGDGEEAFPAWLERGGSEDDLPGVVTTRCRNGKMVPARVQDLDALAFPTRSQMGHRRYELAGSTLNVQTKRGCPFRCLYCNYPAIEGRAMRLRSSQNVVAELAQLRRDGVTKIHFVDSVFTFPAGHAAEICEEMLRRQVSLRWTCGANPQSLAPDLAGLMKRAGCAGVELGIDAANDEMLDALQKGFTLDDALRCSQGCRRIGLPILVHLIFGAPGETPETIKQTLESVRQLAPTAVTYSFGLRVFPQTGLVELLRKHGMSIGDDDLLAPQFYLSHQVTPDMMDLVLNHARQEPHWLAPQQRDSAFAKAIMRAGARLGLPGPAWKYSGIAAPIKRAVAAVKVRRAARAI